MNRKRRYLGMTGMQIGILAGLSACLCVVIGAGAMFIMGNTQPASPDTSSSLPETPTMIPEDAFGPTPTPTLPPTDLPVATPIPGWKKFEGGGVEVWMPGTYEGGDPSQDRAGIVAKIKAMGADFNNIAQEVEQKLSESQYAIFAFDTNVGDALSLTTLQVASETLNSDLVIDMNGYLDAIVQHLDADQRLVDRRIETLDYYEAGRLFIEYKIGDEKISLYRKRAIYVVRVGATMWVLQYITERDDFKNQFPIFEQSIHTFRVHTE